MILNKLLRLKSRTSLLTFLHYIDPLPVEILNSITSLDKLLLLAFNEAVHIKNLTGDKEFLNQVKHLLERIMKEPRMRDFVSAFMSNQIIKPSQTIIKRILESTEFLAKNVFESEVDAQMLPLPQFISAIVSLAINHCPELFNNIRGFLPNVISILMGIFLAKIEKNPGGIRTHVKLLNQTANLLTYVRTHITSYRFVEDVANMQFFIKLMASNNNSKLNNLKTK